MSRNQISFAFAGSLLDFLVGFVVPTQVQARRGTGFGRPPIPPDGVGRQVDPVSGCAPPRGIPAVPPGAAATGGGAS